MVEPLRTMPEAKREILFARLIENPDWREDFLDLIALAERRNEPARPLDQVLADLAIEA